MVFPLQHHEVKERTGKKKKKAKKTCPGFYGVDSKLFLRSPPCFDLLWVQTRSVVLGCVSVCVFFFKDFSSKDTTWAKMLISLIVFGIRQIVWLIWKSHLITVMFDFL